MYQILASALDPYPWLLLLTLAGLAWAWWKQPLARPKLRWALAGLLGLIVVSTPAVAWLALGSLEWGYPPSDSRPTDTRAIVVLGGYLRPPDEVQPAAELGEDTLRRCLVAARLYHGGPPCLVLVSGGKIETEKPGPTLADAMAGFLQRLGVPAEQIVRESRSRSTFENAVESSRLLKQRDIHQVVLVTDATHLARAEACFAGQEIQCLCRGARYRAGEFEFSPGSFLPSHQAPGDIADAVHEWIGAVWYWWRGRV